MIQKEEYGKNCPPKAEEYFNSRRNTLTKREDYKSLIRKRAAQPPIWIIFRVNEEKMKNKVAWRELAPYMQCTPIPSETDIVLSDSPAKRKIILKNKVYFLIEESKERSHFLARFLNSTPVRVFYNRSLQNLAEDGLVITRGLLDSFLFLWTIL